MHTHSRQGGPDADHALTAAPGVGFTSLAAARYRFRAAGALDLSESFPELAGATIAPGQELRYAVFPEWLDDGEAGDGFAAAAIAADLVFTDGSRLSALAAVDQYGVGLTPLAQYEGRILQPDQWHLARVGLDAAVGKTVRRAELVFADTRGGRAGEPAGWVDAVEIAAPPPPPTRAVEWARTRQGTMSSEALSRGGCAPSVGLPNGFVSGIPVTRADELGWPYAWHAHNRADNRPAIEAFATSHLPSPWMGERGAFQIMPALPGRFGAGEPRERALSFSHDGESAHPHLYRVELDGGIRAELTASDHVVLMRFRFRTDEAVLIFDQIRGDGELRLPLPDAGASGAVVTAVTGDERNVGIDRLASPRAHLSAHLDRPVIATGVLERAGAGPVRGWVRVALGEDRTVVVRAATSSIGAAQAARNLSLDGADAGFDVVSGRAGAAWDEWIGRIEVVGATPEQRATMATALYRVGMFPRRGHENLGTAAAPAPHYASPFTPDAPVVAGELSVDQGFWDVYRTAWPLYALLDPQRSARLLDGFVEHFRSGGWTSRWSAPGPIDSMTGTSSDIVFAHAVDAGVPVRTGPAAGGDDHRLDLWAAYESALRNATAPSDDPRVGRKGLARSAFRGWVDTGVREGLSWTLDGAVGDLAVARLAEHLATRVGADHPRADELAASVVYFTARAGTYASSFDARVGFFQGRDAEGRFRLGPDQYDPETWGHDYTETNGWGTAFSAPHDGAGLAALHGGRDGLAAALERFLATPERGVDAVRGSYPHVIHEMTEARNLRMGQWAPSNQPAHHIPFMALFAGRPDLTQRLVHEAASRLFTGGEIGQGWPGDDDNGEMSAWWIFAALGLYPLVPGTAGYVLTAPIFPRTTIALAQGRPLTIEAPAAGPAHRYVRSVRVDGREWTSTFLPHARIAGGATIHVELADTPQPWGNDPAAQPPSLTCPGRMPARLRDLTASARLTSSRGDAGAAVDDDSGSGVVELVAEDWIEVALPEPDAPEMITVTPRLPGRFGFRLESHDGERFTTRARWSAPFAWQRQTRPFLVDAPPASRWRLVAETALDLAQLELLVTGSAADPHVWAPVLR